MGLNTQAGFYLHENGKIYSFPFPRRLIRLGQIIYLVHLENGVHIAPVETIGSKPYFITKSEKWTGQATNLQPTPSLLLTISSEPPNFITEAVDSILPLVDKDLGWFSKIELHKACVALAADVDTSRGNITKVVRSSKLSAVMLASQRLELCARLANEAGYGAVSGHQKSLVYYLLLTCFDRLGQPSPWMSYDEWIASSDMESERDSAVGNLNQTKDPIEIAKSIYKYYISKYGTKNAFFRFMDEVINGEDLKKLLDSIMLTKLDRISGQSTNLTDNDKKKYLYELRNSYTHKSEWRYGVTLAPPALPSELQKEIDDYANQEGVNMESLIFNLYDQQNTATYTKSILFSDWPIVLFETVRAGIVNIIKGALEDDLLLWAELFAEQRAEEEAQEAPSASS